MIIDILPKNKKIEKIRYQNLVPDLAIYKKTICSSIQSGDMKYQSLLPFIK